MEQSKEWQNRSIQEQEVILSRAWEDSKRYLAKYGLTSQVPTRNDSRPNVIALYKDNEAVEAIRIARTEREHLRYLKDPERFKALVNESSRKWGATHKPEKAAMTKADRVENPEKFKLREEVWRAVNPDYYRRWSEVHPGRAYEITKAWNKANPDKARANNHCRRMREAGVPGSHTSEEWLATLKDYGNKCFYCDKSIDEVGELTEDHLTPISVGGSDWIDNIVPACRSCNSSKGSKTFEEYIDWLKRLSSY
jgi:5-methylcytosine-specific restriction endonuclease McrA